LIDIFKVLGL